MRRSGSTTRRERFPGLKDDLGEDPAYWLDRPLLEPSVDASDPVDMIRARIDGIDKIPVARSRSWWNAE